MLTCSLFISLYPIEWPRHMEVLIKLHAASPSRSLPWTLTHLLILSCRTLASRGPASTEWPRAGSQMGPLSYCLLSLWTLRRSLSPMTSKLHNRRAVYHPDETLCLSSSMISQQCWDVFALSVPAWHQLEGGGRYFQISTARFFMLCTEIAFKFSLGC